MNIRTQALIGTAVAAFLAAAPSAMAEIHTYDIDFTTVPGKERLIIDTTARTARIVGYDAATGKTNTNNINITMTGLKVSGATFDDNPGHPQGQELSFTGLTGWFNHYSSFSNTTTRWNADQNASHMLTLSLINPGGHPRVEVWASWRNSTNANDVIGDIVAIRGGHNTSTPPPPPPPPTSTGTPPPPPPPPTSTGTPPPPPPPTSTGTPPPPPPTSTGTPPPTSTGTPPPPPTPTSSGTDVPGPGMVGLFGLGALGLGLARRRRNRSSSKKD